MIAKRRIIMHPGMNPRSIGMIGLFLAALVSNNAAFAQEQAADPASPAQSDIEKSLIAVREIRKKDDKLDLTIRHDTLYVDVISPSGIGGTRLVLTSGNWPKKVVVRLKYSPDKPFTRIEGPSATLEAKDEKDEYLEVRLSPNKDGYEARLPHSKRKTLHLHWIDAYR